MYTVDNLIELRKLLNMSQAEFAAQLGITRESINKMERGKSNMSRRTVSRLKQLLEKHSLDEYSQDVNIFWKSFTKGLGCQSALSLAAPRAKSSGYSFSGSVGGY